MELEFSSTVKDATLEELKKLIFKNFEKDKHLWKSRGDLKELKELVNGSVSIPSLISKLGEILNVQYKV